MAKPSSAELAGMTVNERFVELGLLDQFHVAARARDRKTMIELYRAAEVEGADTAVDWILSNPQTYGF